MYIVMSWMILLVEVSATLTPLCPQLLLTPVPETATEYLVQHLVLAELMEPGLTLL